MLLNAAIDDLDFPQVSCDDAVAVQQAMGHLIALGHERIGLVLGPPDHVPSRRKLAAARELAVAGRAWSCPTSTSSTPCSPSRAARRPPPGCCQGE